jgi:hypothetical protein
MVVSPNVFFNVTGNPAAAVLAEPLLCSPASPPQAASVVVASSTVVTAPTTRVRDQDMVILLRLSASTKESLS